MVSVLIIDDNRAISAYLKMSLTRQQHQVRRSRDIRQAVFPSGGKAPDLVLINHATGNFTGWELFNHLKQVTPELPAMVYVMESRCSDATAWICRAVEAACEPSPGDYAPPAPSPPDQDPAAMKSAAIRKKRFR